MNIKKIRRQYNAALSKFKRSVDIKNNLQDKLRRINTLQEKSAIISRNLIHSAENPDDLIKILKVTKLHIDKKFIYTGWKNTQRKDIDFNVTDWNDVLTEYSHNLELKITEQCSKKQNE